ncbi:DUF3825 domain-containing protein [Pontibacter sp. G13]|uniref:DUF3825 domain-containing protein n=1 Tax=Pontibacter sp. G13 TaxID=3074898 RepID=UPI00288A6A84|nr:DUF3825 domain-containing protein [Pontibacter sp. G13]WNJ18989.1 DUF3825 domain-containing protein [Pontibacter sp. G13]
MEIGVVSFFNVERGFGKIRSERYPTGVFVHYRDVLGDARILVHHEMVEFQVVQTEKGPKAKQVVRLTERYSGRIASFSKGYGYVRADQDGRLYFLHHSDVVGVGHKHIEPQFEVEFSPFESSQGIQAKEVVIRDTRPAWIQFAQFQDLGKSYQQLAEWAIPEDWNLGSEIPPEQSRLHNYLIHTFRQAQIQGQVRFGKSTDNVRIACFHTGLYTPDWHAIYGWFIPNSATRPDGAAYLKNPHWVFEKWVISGNRELQWLDRIPQAVKYLGNEVKIGGLSERDWQVDWKHLLDDRKERFPIMMQKMDRGARMEKIRLALEIARMWMARNPFSAVAQWYHGRFQWLLPACLEDPQQADLAFVLGYEQGDWQIQTVLPLESAYRNARLIAPVQADWLR